MAAGEEEKAPEAQEDECVLCHRSDTSLDGCGPMLKVDGVCAHVHCLFPAQGLYQRGPEGEGILGFRCADIRRVAGRAARKVRAFLEQMRLVAAEPKPWQRNPRGSGQAPGKSQWPRPRP
eukprot:XP_027320442.1 PHD finger protein 7-like [Anas platyrhynchos]